MTKKQAVKKIKALVKEQMDSLTKNIDAILTEAKCWYSKDDLITKYDDLHPADSKNADQLIIDHATAIMLGDINEFENLEEKHLWTKNDIKKGTNSND